ncbi:DUF4256 domain-containing protein [[Acholeplasma] multilocale]|uniref:DUF4256 domain-containing protein n=1 Tax=[Acholeplasma] multilocale TaxID=264638 RepID=UPI0006871B4E|nr:DUF4256 domain-containing protein [[Acholeplasma] multilocale]
MVKKLQQRFNDNLNRHPNVLWSDVLNLLVNKEIMDAINFMEETGGEPDILKMNDNLYVVDFSKETPDRKSLCYDKESRINRKKFPPVSSVLESCEMNSLELIDLEIYSFMQSIEDLDLKTSSWLKTPDDIRILGGAIFAEKRYDKTFVFHNSADSYYSNRGFRSYIKLK